MTAANTIQRSITPAPTITQTILKNALILSFADITNFGSAPFKEYTSGTDVFLVYKFINDAVPIYGTIYFSIKISSALAVNCQLLVGFDGTSNTSTFQTTIQTAVTFSASSAIQFFAIDHAELKGIFLKQGSTVQPLVWVRPAFKRPAWSENTCAWAFHPSGAGFSSWAGFTNTFYANANTYTIGSFSQLSGINTAESTYDLLPMGAILFFNSNIGYAGFFSSDITVGACASVQLLARINITGGSFLILQVQASGMVVLANANNVIS